MIENGKNSKLGNTNITFTKTANSDESCLVLINN